MATQESIIAAIYAKVGPTSHSIWRIGLTHDLDERKRYWKDTEKQSIDYWSDWKSDSLRDAQTIEARFIAKGMKGGTGGDLSASKTVYVYVF
jgi:hypothetical protein